MLRGLAGLTRRAAKVARRGARQVEQAGVKRRATETALRGAGEFLPGMVLGPRGARRYRLYLPPDARAGAAVPLLVMLHGCDQDAVSFAASTRMNRIAERERFAVLYPEQDRLSNLNGCWHWFDLDSGRAQAEATSVLQAIDRVCNTYPVDATAVAIAGLSAGASLAALLAVAHPTRFCAVALHSGVPPGAAHSPAGALRAMRGRARSVPVPAPAAAQDAAPPWPALLVLHGSRDSVVAPSNGRETALRWAQACGAIAQAPRHEQRGQRHAMCITDFNLGRRTRVTLIEVAGLGHAWSGGAARQRYGDPKGPDASGRIWRFVARELRLRREQAGRSAE